MNFKMPIYEYKEEMSLGEQVNGAYWERNMLALRIAIDRCLSDPNCKDGWYYDTDNNWVGWRRVITLYNGAMTFHVPDDFDLGMLPETYKNWDGHTTIEKWKRVMGHCGCSVIEEDEMLMKGEVCPECGSNVYMSKNPIEIRPFQMPVHKTCCVNNHHAHYFIGNIQRTEKENEDGPVRSRAVFPNTYSDIDPVSKDNVLEKEE